MLKGSLTRFAMIQQLAQKAAIVVLIMENARPLIYVNALKDGVATIALLPFVI